MTSRISLFLTSTALTLALGLPAFAAMQTQHSMKTGCSEVCTAFLSADDQSAQFILASDDDDDDHRRGWFRRGHDDDDDDDDEDDDDCNNCKGGRGNPAPAGTVAPPANGLFGNGAPPVAVTN